MRTALYTTVYPGVERFFKAWYDSARAQRVELDLAIALDGVSVEQLERAAGEPIQALWFYAPPRSSFAQIRGSAWRELCGTHEAIVMSDADDVMRPGRVRSALDALQSADLIACGMQLVDERLKPLGLTIEPGRRAQPESYLFKVNDFGLTNTAWRAEALRRALPLPKTVRLVDWHIATQAVGLGLRLATRPEVMVEYRQYEGNMTQHLPPYSAALIERASGEVSAHYEALSARAEAWPVASARQDFERARARHARFAQAIKARALIDDYVEALNALDAETHSPFKWWACVAHPELKRLWT